MRRNLHLQHIYTNTTQAFIGESLSLYERIQEALNLNVKHLRLEVVNLLVINSIEGIWSIWWKLQHIITNIKALLHSLGSWDIKNIYREANKASYWIANIGQLICDNIY